MTPVGGQFQINVETAGAQGAESVAMAPDGRFVITWGSGPSVQDSDSYSVHGRRFDASGSPQGGQFLVNSVTTGSQAFSSVAIAPSGIFTVVWTHEEDPTAQPQTSVIRSRQFRANGTATGPEIEISSQTTNAQRAPHIAHLPNGEFFVTWGLRESSNYRLLGRRLNASGDPIADEIEISEGYLRRELRTIPSPTGEFLVVWSGYVPGPGGFDPVQRTWAKRYNSAGLAMGAEFQVDPPEDDFQNELARSPDAFFQDDGGFTVVWSSLDVIYGQAFDAAGDKLGDELVISDDNPTTLVKEYPRVVREPNGDWLVVWSSFTAATEDFDIRGQRMTAGGERQGPSFRLNTVTAGDQRFPNLAGDGQLRAIAVWPSETSAGSDTDGWSAQGQLLDLPPLTIFVDGFESGDTTSWTETIP
ncbi:MAG: hypothetical protein AAGM22_04795 [Acidobacteriota bacterium]